MNCPFCNKQLINNLCADEQHSFYLSDSFLDDWCLFDFKNKIRIGSTHSSGNYIMFLPSVKIITIDYFKMENALEIINKYLKLKAFI